LSRRHSLPLRCAARVGAAAFASAWILLATLLAAPAAGQAPPFAAPADATAEAGEPSVAEALRLLAIVLDDPEARAALVEQLRAVEPAAPAAPDPGAAPDGAVEPAAVPQVLADQTLEIAEEMTGRLVGILGEVLALGEIVALARGFDYRAAWVEVRPVAIVIGIVFATLWALRLLARPLLSRFEGSAALSATALAPLRWKFFGVLIEAARVLLAWAVGYAAAFAYGGGAVAYEYLLFLGALLGIEGTRAALRVVFRPGHAGLRLIRLSDGAARRWYFWLSRILGVLGYGMLFLAPLAAFVGAPRLAAWLVLAGGSIATSTGNGAFRYRDPVRRGLEARLGRARGDLIASWLYPLAHYWHLIAIAYILALFVVWRAMPGGDAVLFMVRATLSSLVFGLFGSLLIAVITRRIADGVAVSEDARARFPTLESRLNRFVPWALQVLRVAVAVAVTAGILTFWDVIDATGWAASPVGRAFIGSLLWIALILFVAIALYLVVSSWIEYRLNPNVGAAPTPRERTLLALFSNAFVIVLAIITTMTVLTEVGINIAPLLAGAGVVGLAIGFGAQKLVQDIINGAFIQFENTMNEGDIVTAGAITGVVEKLTIRSVSLRDFNGRYHMIPFSGVDNVTNFTKTFSFHVADIGVAYRENLHDVQDAMQEAFDRLMETPHRAEILPPFEQYGIDQFADSAIVVRGRIKTLPGKQFGVGRAYNGFVKEVFDERGIEIPFPHRTIYMGADKRGEAPPLNLRDVGRRRDPARPAAAPQRPVEAAPGPLPDGDLALPEPET
jgi:moderate conductance mechanosensitive channel